MWFRPYVCHATWLQHPHKSTTPLPSTKQHVPGTRLNMGSDRSWQLWIKQPQKPPHGRYWAAANQRHHLQERAAIDLQSKLQARKLNIWEDQGPVIECQGVHPTGTHAAFCRKRENACRGTSATVEIHEAGFDLCRIRYSAVWCPRRVPSTLVS